MPLIDKVLYTEACPFEYDRFPDSSTVTIVLCCEHGYCTDNENGLCEAEENVWRRR